MSGLDYLKRFLNDEGYRYTDNGGHISFKFEGTRYIAFSNNDNPCLQLVLLFYDVTADNRAQVLEACNKINRDKFVVKLTADDDSVWVNYEFYPDENNTAEQYERILNQMESVHAEFYGCMEPEEEN